MHRTDFLVIGSGVAGMWFALEACRHGKVTMITKTRPLESNSAYAQGGIASVWSEDDDPEFHIRDTLVAGAGLCRAEAVDQTVREGPIRVRELIERGAEFTRRQSNPDEYDLHREGGHSHRRILHAADFTGKEMVRALNQEVMEHPQIEFLDHHIAIDVLTRRWLARRLQQVPPEDDEAIGAYVLDTSRDEVELYAAKVVVLATGGAGKVYVYTTNPPIASGDGHAMAWRAGARMANMEFVQFHPTCLFHATENSFLISEALRGEGGKLIGPDGQRFMDRYDERAELAPRDIVARAIDNELKTRGLECVYLDMRHMSREEVARHFPTIDTKLLSLGIDMTRDPIPVVPAAHYMCGGVQTDLNGESSIRNLFAVGEVACTGLHGANRLASNSLLEALVFAHTAARESAERLAAIPPVPDLPAWDPGKAGDSDEAVVITQTWDEIRRFMWNYVGIVRTHRRLKRAQRRLQLVRDEVDKYYWDFRVTGDLIELRNLVDVAHMIVECALRRRESRGLHYTLDFPEPDERNVSDTVIRRWS
ncbi:MAG: L-aspartate oxidase [Alphaproteobacteria bacterium]|nr:L-aspartate oxidase [Alphaproteobacteria bacterium]